MDILLEVLKLKTAKHKNNKKRLTLLKAISSNEIIGYKIFEKQ